jgi:hypothetical protein
LASEEKNLVQTGLYYYLTHKTLPAKHANRSDESKDVLFWTKKALKTL